MGAATLLIHIEAKVATNINTSNTTLGRLPAALRIRVAVMTSRRVLESTAAMVKPPIRSMIVGENICEKMYLYVSFDLDKLQRLTSSRQLR